MLRAGVLQLMSHTAAATIRAARGEDFPQVRALLERNDLPIDGVPENLTGYAVATHDDRVVGVAGIEHCDNYSLLRSVAVDENARNHGIARTLVEQLIDEERAMRTKSIFLLTTTAASYFPMLGFAVVERESVPDAIRATQEFRETCPSSATVMRLDLNSE